MIHLWICFYILIFLFLSCLIIFDNVQITYLNSQGIGSKNYFPQRGHIAFSVRHLKWRVGNYYPNRNSGRLHLGYSLRFSLQMSLEGNLSWVVTGTPQGEILDWSSTAYGGFPLVSSPANSILYCHTLSKILMRTHYLARRISSKFGKL